MGPTEETMKIHTRSPRICGEMDYYYGRQFSPHKYMGTERDVNLKSKRAKIVVLTKDEREEYRDGFHNSERKDWR